MIKVSVQINGETVLIDRALLEKDETGREYGHYLQTKVNGIYRPDLEIIGAEVIETLKADKRADRDALLVLANYAVMDAEDRGEDPTSAKAWRIALKDFPNRLDHPEWYIEALPELGDM